MTGMPWNPLTRSIKSENELRTIAYLRMSFEPEDRLAVVLLNKQTRSVIQRVAPAEKIATSDFQAWLRYQNARHHEVYISMNTLQEDARGRSKAEIAKIRHVYLDFDKDGAAAVQSLFARKDFPTPSFTLRTSPDKRQVIWRVDGFGKQDAEDLQKSLARDTGADPAATDCARVMRLPGFYNHKYDRPHLVYAEAHASVTDEVYQPTDFPNFPPFERCPSDQRSGLSSKRTTGELTQSERDWAYARRALARGDPENLIVTAITVYRRLDKHNPQAYAELTVRKASDSLRMDHGETPER